MPTKTDRILSYLPGTFQTAPRPPVLYAVADAFGNELLLGENSLAAIMLAHWADFADRNAARIDDLERLAALYGLAPRRDEDGESLESVEEFREHLKRYVRTFLEGTVTVQGILRVTAEVLGLRIADETELLDRWWTRQRDEVIKIRPRGDDAAALLRFERPHASGSPARPGQVTGSVDLSAGIDLQDASILRLRVDGLSLGDIDLAKDIPPPARLELKQIVEAINQSPRPQIARHDGHYLTLASPTAGPSGKVELLGGPNDAAPLLLGLAPRSYHGAAATAAQFAGGVDLSHGVNLSHERFLRIQIDDVTDEIDCDAGERSLVQICEAINQAFGRAVASDDGKHVILTSPTKGFRSVVSIQPPASQNAAERIFGVASAFQTGRDDQPARVTSNRDLRGGVDLSECPNLSLRIDGAATPVVINCAGVNPASTQRVEIVAAINAALKAEVANITERAVSLTSPIAGSGSEIVFEAAQIGDAASIIFGTGASSFAGAAATRARLIATPILTPDGGVDLRAQSVPVVSEGDNPPGYSDGGVDLRAQSVLSMALDGGPAVEIDLRTAAETVLELKSTSLEKLAATINHALGDLNVAASDEKRLLLASPTEGGGSSLEIKPLERTQADRFATRAIVTDEATRVIFGFDEKRSSGMGATPARVVGANDLSQSVDLREARFLRLKVDGYPAVEIDCAGRRLRATTLDEVVEQINVALKVAGVTKDVATHDGKSLVLVSPSSGADSKLAFEPPRGAADKLRVELGTFHGQDATQVRFTGIVDLSSGIDLAPNAAIKLGFDATSPIEISLAGPTPNHQSLFQIMTAINSALKSVATTDGKHIILSSAKKGPDDSKLVFEVPSGHDATEEIFGIAAPRTYKGAAATPARIKGMRELINPIDLSVSRFLRLSVDGGPAQDLDCASKAINPQAATLDEIVKSLGEGIAAKAENNLVLVSPTSGANGQLRLEAYTAGDARQQLLRDVEDLTTGLPATPAVITGGVDLLAPVNLGKRSILRIAVDGSSSRDVDVGGTVPSKTFLDEIVTAINRVLPNVASATDKDLLELTSPTAGEESSLSVLPLRYLEVIEYPPESRTLAPVSVRHGDSLSVVNEGAADAFAEVQITAPQGAVGPTLVNSTVGWSLRLFTAIDVGETARLRLDAQGGLQSEIISGDGKTRPVPGSRILVGPLGAQAWVPFQGTWNIGDEGDAATLQLNNPLAAVIVLLRAKSSNEIAVSVVESDLTHLASQPTGGDGSPARLIGRLQADQTQFRLVDGAGKPIAQLRAGPNAILSAYDNKVVKVTGPLHAGAPPLMIVQTIDSLFDVTLRFKTKNGSEENFRLVTIGSGETDKDSLVGTINAGSDTAPPSKLVHAEELNKSTILSVPRGKTDFRYLDCLGPRFDQARFERERPNADHDCGATVFPDGICCERGVFDISRVTQVPPEKVKTVFASEDPLSDPQVKIGLRWPVHQPGSFIVNLPSDLPASFGGRFNEARFGQSKDAPEMYEQAVAEPQNDDRFLAKLINQNSDSLVTAEVVGSVPLGWAPEEMPFRKPKVLTLGRPGQAARLYLSEEGLSGFIKLEAKEKGGGGNEIAVATRQVGPAVYDVSVIYSGSRFENARSVVMGQPPAELAQARSKPIPVGVLQAKAAGVLVEVTRDRAEFEQLTIVP